MIRSTTTLFIHIQYMMYRMHRYSLQQTIWVWKVVICVGGYNGTSTTTDSDNDDESNYNFLSIMMPLLMVCFITLIVSCIVLVYVLRRKRRQVALNRAHREQVQHSLISDASLGGMDINGDLNYGRREMCI